MAEPGAFTAARTAPGPPAMMTPAATAHAAHPIIDPQPLPLTVDGSDTDGAEWGAPATIVTVAAAAATCTRGDDATPSPSIAVRDAILR